MSSEMDLLKTDVEKLTKLVKKLQKQVNKMNKLFPVDDIAEKKPSGFSKPMKISSALAKFLGVTEDTMISRTAVTQKITAYVKEHSLQNAENKREFKVDKKMEGIITLPPGEVLSFFNLQHYMKDHYVKEPVVETPKVSKVKAKPVVKQTTDTKPATPAAAPKVIKRTGKKQ